MTAVATSYLEALCERLSALKVHLAQPMAAAANAIVNAAKSDRLVYVFGTGHSHMLAEEVHYRAGGLALAVPILASPFMLHEGAIASSNNERTEGIAGPILDRYEIADNDVLFIISNSGVNAVPLEAARMARSIGCTVIAITSLAYSTAAANGGEKLADLADIVIDNGIPPGDAIIDLPGTSLKSGPASTAIGAAIINAIFSEAAHQLAEHGQPPIYLSANMPGARESNRALVERYAKRNRHL
ncbi:MAG: SIS domain-containing protein [Pseudomonadota bacterium]